MQVSQDELNKIRNFMWNKRVKAHLMLISNTNTNHESVAIDPLDLQSLKLEVSKKLPHR
jgi:hypothetical protein